MDISNTALSRNVILSIYVKIKYVSDYIWVTAASEITETFTSFILAVSKVSKAPYFHTSMNIKSISTVSHDLN